MNNLSIKLFIVLSSLLVVQSCSKTKQETTEAKPQLKEFETSDCNQKIDSLTVELEKVKWELEIQRKLTQKQAEIMARDTSSY